MEDKNNSRKTNTKKSSNMPKRKTTKSVKQVQNISSDELLEQIMNKKKTKSVNKSTTTRKSTATKTTKSTKKIETTTLSNDDIYDLIKSKKKKSKTVEKVVSDKEELDKSLDSEVEKKELTLDIKTESSTEENKKNVEDSFIITREIRFTDDKLDLKNKKLLKELNDAILEFDSLDKEDSIVPVAENTVEQKNKKKKVKTIDDEIGKLLPAIRYDKQDRTKFFLITGICVLSLFMVCMLGWYFLIKPSYASDNDFNKVLNIVPEEEPDIRPQLMEECMKRPLDESDRTPELIVAENNLTEYLKNNYRTSVAYEDLNLGFKYSYNTDVVYYAASTIKSLGALYMYTKARDGEINLDDTMKYTAKFKWSSSKEMSKHKIGDEVSLRKLVEYSVVVSDNTAHQMLVSYIGKSTLKEFGKSLGAEYTMSTSDNFGNISTSDALIYAKAINDFINSSGELGEELKSYMVRAEQNDLELPDLDIKAAHKYGQYSYFYHDIGIVYDSDPYVVAILTHEGNKDFEKIVKDINRHVYELHRAYNDNRENVCYTEVYGS